MAEFGRRRDWLEGPDRPHLLGTRIKVWPEPVSIAAAIFVKVEIDRAFVARGVMKRLDTATIHIESLKPFYA